MVDRPDNREDALDIVWGYIRNNNEGWLKLFPKSHGSTVRDVVRALEWSQTTTRGLMEELVKRGQLIKKWNHQHQSYWNAHYSTPNELPHGGNPEDPDVSDIPF